MPGRRLALLVLAALQALPAGGLQLGLASSQGAALWEEAPGPRRRPWLCQEHDPGERQDNWLADWLGQTKGADGPVGSRRARDGPWTPTPAVSQSRAICGP